MFIFTQYITLPQLHQNKANSHDLTLGYPSSYAVTERNA